MFLILLWTMKKSKKEKVQRQVSKKLLEKTKAWPMCLHPPEFQMQVTLKPTIWKGLSIPITASGSTWTNRSKQSAPNSVLSWAIFPKRVGASIRRVKVFAALVPSNHFIRRNKLFLTRSTLNNRRHVIRLILKISIRSFDVWQITVMRSCDSQ